ncbi:MAG TPA: hypothetical protein VK672_04750, partial [Solirubrobacteraceae bacterium]|nr:hypothetical protein [Solirubrobacteraceae bacterium]
MLHAPDEPLDCSVRVNEVHIVDCQITRSELRVQGSADVDGIRERNIVVLQNEHGARSDAP